MTVIFNVLFGRAIKYLHIEFIGVGEVSKGRVLIWPLDGPTALGGLRAEVGRHRGLAD